MLGFLENVSGLPPVTTGESAGLVFEISPNAWEKGRDPLLTSSQPVDQRASHWLDFARFAEAGGCDDDTLRRKEWRHYDGGVNCFNDAKPHEELL